jgi:hypothetical protein
MAAVLISTMSDAASGVEFKIYAEVVNGEVVFTIEHISGNADIQGFFVDVGNDGGAITSVGSKSNNMNGSSNDGDKLDGFDYATSLGTVGGSDANYTSPGTSKSFTIAGITSLDQLDGAQLGIRATSTGPDGSGSLKLAEIAEIPPVGPPPGDNHFPEWGAPSISHVTFYFDTTEGDVKPNPAGDDWFTVKFDDDANLSDDLDDWYDDALAFIIAQNPDLVPSTVAGVSIKGGTKEVWYDLDNDPNDDDSANAPSVWIVENNEVDQAYSVTDDSPFIAV